MCCLMTGVPDHNVVFLKPTCTLPFLGTWQNGTFTHHCHKPRETTLSVLFFHICRGCFQYWRSIRDDAIRKKNGKRKKHRVMTRR